jgi:deazaflavin-dependent oxidoreductase (nitroreductase family)
LILGEAPRTLLGMSEFGARKTYEPGRFKAVENAMTSVLARVGVIPQTYLLTVVGRKSGVPRSNPVTLVELDGRRWLVAPYGPVDWVRNARVAGEVRVSRGRRSRSFAIREVEADEAAPVLRRYVEVASVARPYFAAQRGDPAPAFAAEATAHPVFELLPRPSKATAVPSSEG